MQDDRREIEELRARVADLERRLVVLEEARASWQKAILEFDREWKEKERDALGIKRR